MYWKGFWVAAAVTLVILIGATLFLHSQNNQDIPNFNCKRPLIDANSVREHPKHNGDFEVIMISTGCPGRHGFMPEVIAYTEALREKGIPYFVINDDYIGPTPEVELDHFKNELGLTDTVYYLDRTTYPDSEGLFFGKLRYRQFVEDLCGPDDQFPFGYALTLRFQSGHYAGWTMAYPDSARRESLRRFVIENS